MVAKNESIFNANDASQVLKVLSQAPDAVTIIGCISLWEIPKNQLVAAFQKLIDTFQTLTKHTFGPGT